MPNGTGYRRIVRVKCIDAVIDGSDEDQIVSASANPHIGRQQRLPINLIVQHSLEEHAEMFPVHVSQSQDSLLEVRSRSREIVVLSQNIHLTNRGYRSESGY